MKIERINDSQMKFMLTKNDLDKRSLDVSDLAYGSSKTQELFQDIIDTACKEFSFNMDDTPLMIDAVPTSKTSIMIILTKVSNPVTYQESENGFKKISNGEDFLPLTPKNVTGDSSKTTNTNLNKRILKNSNSKNLIFKFDSLDDVTNVSQHLANFDLVSSLYKIDSNFILNVLLVKGSGNELKMIENVLNEYGTRMQSDEKVMLAYLSERAKTLIRKNAIKVMANL